MKSFSFSSQEDENVKIERIISERKHKIAIQQVIYSSILALIILGALIYTYNKLHYETFDGYVSAEHWEKRAISDLYIDRCYVEAGDIVFPGDTLFSYIMLDNIMKLHDITREPSIIAQDRTIRLQSGVNSPDINLLQTRIQELRKQIDLENNNIRFGMSDNSHKMDLERELAETRAQLRSAQEKLKAYNSMKAETTTAIQNSAYAQSSLPEQDFELQSYLHDNPEAIGYSISDDTLVISQRSITDKTYVLKGEPMLLTHRLNLTQANVMIETYVPTDKIKYLNNSTEAEIIVSDDVSFNASLSLLGARTEALPSDLKRSLSRVYKAVIVEFRPEADQEIPYWAVVDGVPVTVRINKFKNYSTGNRYHDYWYIGDNGLLKESLDYLMKTIKNK